MDLKYVKYEPLSKPTSKAQTDDGGFVPMKTQPRITIDPNVCVGKPCIRGMRIRVSDILSMLAAGASQDEILEDYPYLEADDIAAALDFAARQTDHPILRAA